MIRIRQIFAIVLLLTAAVTAASQKLVGSGLLRFGWKPDRCTEAIGDMSRYTTTIDASNPDVEKFSYAPASWEGIAFDGSVLDFYKKHLYQIGFYRASSIADRTTFNAVVKRLTEVYGEPRQIAQGNPDHLIWRAKGGNLAMAEYTYKDGVFSTYLMLIDNATTQKRSKDRQGH